MRRRGFLASLLAIFGVATKVGPYPVSDPAVLDLWKRKGVWCWSCGKTPTDPDEYSQVKAGLSCLECWGDVTPMQGSIYGEKSFEISYSAREIVLDI